MPRPAFLPVLCLLSAGCADFSMPTRAERPEVSAAEPREFFAGQALTVTGLRLDGGKGEAPQVLVGGKLARLLGGVEPAGDRQRVAVEAPAELARGAPIKVIVKTSAGEATGPSPLLFLGPGHPAAAPETSRTRISVQPGALAVGAGVALIHDWEHGRIVVFDTAFETVSQVLPIRVPVVEEPASSRADALIEDLAVDRSGRRALLSYWLPVGESEVWSRASGLVALRQCGGRWRAVRHLQLPKYGGRFQRLLYQERGDAFFATFGLADGPVGIAKIAAAQIPADCDEGRAEDGLAPEPDDGWAVEYLTEEPGLTEYLFELGFSLSDDGTRLAVVRPLGDGSLIVVYDVESQPPREAWREELLGAEARSIADVVLVGQPARLAAVDYEADELLFEEEPGDGFAGAVVRVPSGTDYLYSAGDGRVLAATPTSLFVVDPRAGRSVGSLPLGSLLSRALPVPGSPNQLIGVLEATATENGRVLRLDRDALAVTSLDWSMEYPLRSAAYYGDLAMFLLDPREDVGLVVYADLGSSFAHSRASIKREVYASAGVAGSLDAGFYAGLRRQGDALEPFVRAWRRDPALVPGEPVPPGTLDGALIWHFVSGSPGEYLAIQPYKRGVIGLKRTGLERIGADECDVPMQERGRAVMPAACTAAFQGFELPDGVQTFAVAEGAKVAFVPQDVRHEDATVVAAKIGLDGRPLASLKVEGGWTTRAISASRDGQVVALLLAPDGPPEGCEQAGTPFVAMGPGGPLRPMEGLACQAGSVAVSPDGEFLYVGSWQGRIYAFPLDSSSGVDLYIEPRPWAIPGGYDDWVDTLTVSPDGAFLSGTLRYPRSAAFVLR